jgi:FSR family fosmidomycin resistance protein-like MFS transporter
MSFYMLGGELARTLGPLVILGAVSLWGMEGTYRLIPLGIIASIILFFRLRKIPIRQDFSHTKEAGARQTFRKMIPFFITVAGIILFRAAMKSALTLYLPTYLTSRGTSIWLAGISLAILQFSGAGCTFFSGIISDKIGRKNALLIITIINPILMFLFLFVHGVWTIPILIITGFFLFAIGPVMLAFIHDINSRHMSFINGIYMTINFAVSSLIVLLVGYLSDTIGIELTFRISAWLAFGSIPFVLSIKNKPYKGNH